jgi:hypothetical protein
MLRRERNRLQAPAVAVGVTVAGVEAEAIVAALIVKAVMVTLSTLSSMNRADHLGTNFCNLG